MNTDSAKVALGVSICSLVGGCEMQVRWIEEVVANSIIFNKQQGHLSNNITMGEVNSLKRYDNGLHLEEKA